LRGQEHHLRAVITKAERENQDHRQDPHDRQLRRKLDTEAARAAGVRPRPKRKRRAWVVGSDLGTSGPASEIRHVDPATYVPQSDQH
jgi:hypothetical protein